MVKALLVQHKRKYPEAMSALSSAPQVRDALGLTDSQTSVEGTIGFIEFLRFCRIN